MPASEAARLAIADWSARGDELASVADMASGRWPSGDREAVGRGGGPPVLCRDRRCRRGGLEVTFTTAPTRQLAHIASPLASKACRLPDLNCVPRGVRAPSSRDGMPWRVDLRVQKSA
eukprot:scaffold14788_cov127-Isochrysis_galbana.AAC.4